MAFASISMGQYVPIKSFVHSLDPRAKLLSLVVIVAAAFPSGDLPSLFRWALAFWGVARLAGLSVKMVLRSCRPVFFLAFFSLAFNVAAELWDLDVWETSGVLRGFHTGFVASGRLLLLVFITVLLPLTTAPMELADGME
ncbi:MAG: energy-coupling factor transporter transmembrane protein EcfT, partial [Synergistaceae bacterium]|nr:energy-coupling factor transporter transmembrane protein EcfT [Synergistaceae bacterium]